MANNKNLVLKFELTDVEYHVFSEKMTRLKIKALASRLKNIDYYYRDSEYNGKHLIEIGLKRPDDSSQYDLVGTITRLTNADDEKNRQKIDLVGNYVNMTKDDYREISNHNDLREEPCAVCGSKNKRRRKMFLMLDNTTGEYEYVGSECVQKLMPEWSLDVFRKLFENLIKLQTMFQKNKVTKTPTVNVEEILHQTFNELQTDSNNDNQTNQLIELKHDELNNKVFKYFYSGDIENKKYSITNKLLSYHSEIELMKRNIDINYYDDNQQYINNQIKACDELYERFHKNQQLVLSQSMKAGAKINQIVKQLSNSFTFEETIEAIKKTREWPNKAGYNLREELGTNSIPVSLINSTKEAYKKFVNSKFNPSSDLETLSERVDQQFGKDNINKLRALDKKYIIAASKIAKVINNKLSQIEVNSGSMFKATTAKYRFLDLPLSEYKNYVTE